MAEVLTRSQAEDRESRYRELLPQLEALISSETDVIANMANVCAALRETFGFLWIGFYRVENTSLILGPFQGPIACTRIAFGRGVCGTAWSEARLVLVDDVDQFPGHIACSSASRSEIVVPILSEKRVVAVLDIDSDQLADFGPVDAQWLTLLAQHLGQRWPTL